MTSTANSPSGNPALDSELPSKGYSNGVIALDARTGELSSLAQLAAPLAGALMLVLAVLETLP